MFSGLTNTATSMVEWGVVLGVCLVAAVWDLTRRRIPNLLVLPVFLGGLTWALSVGGPSGLAGALGGSVVLCIPYVLLFVLAGGGAGDAKLMVAIGAWLGVVNGLIVLATVSLVAVVLGTAISIRKRRLSDLVLKMAQVAWWMAGVLGLAGRVSRKPHLDDSESIGTIPYAVVVAVGVCLAGAATMLWRS